MSAEDIRMWEHVIADLLSQRRDMEQQIQRLHEAELEAIDQWEKARLEMMVSMPHETREEQWN